MSVHRGAGSVNRLTGSLKFELLEFLAQIGDCCQVQESVANCLPPLVPAIKSDASDLVCNLMSLLLDSDNYGERRGAAYGLAGLTKGLGILALKQLDIMNTLTEAMQDKKNPKHREGSFLTSFCDGFMSEITFIK